MAKPSVGVSSELRRDEQLPRRWGCSAFAGRRSGRHQAKRRATPSHTHPENPRFAASPTFRPTGTPRLVSISARFASVTQVAVHTAHAEMSISASNTLLWPKPWGRAPVVRAHRVPVCVSPTRRVDVRVYAVRHGVPRTRYQYCRRN